MTIAGEMLFDMAIPKAVDQTVGADEEAVAVLETDAGTIVIRFFSMASRVTFTLLAPPDLVALPFHRRPNDAPRL